MADRLITSPVCEPVTLAEAKLHCRIDHAYDDTLLSMLITAARRHAEHLTGRAFVEQTRELTLDVFPASFEIPRPPLGEVVSIKYDDEDGAERTLSESSYAVVNASDSVPAVVFPAYGAVWPSTRDMPGAVRIRYTTGWPVTGEGTEGSPYAATTPEDIKQWMLVRISGLYTQRENFGPGQIFVMPRDHIDGLLDPWTLMEVA